MTLQELKDSLASEWKRMGEIQVRALGSDVALVSSLNGELLSQEGKQVRPLLCLLAARLCGGATENTLRYGAALEILHNATLIHDDVTDGSDLRRGRPSVRSLCGSGAAVLLGDFWLSTAVSCIIDGDSLSQPVLRRFSTTLHDLAEGEMLQLQKASDGGARREDYLRIIYAKTASLFETAAFCGAVSAGADAAALEALSVFGRCAGMAFQIRDDVLDWDGGPDLGKPVGEDILEKKITLPLLEAFAASGGKGEAELRELIVRDPAAARQPAADYIRRYDGLERARTVQEQYMNQALEALSPFAPSPEREALAFLARYMGERKV